ncbi:nickel-dependent hydrogenase large subunit [Pinisolibacter aquiterrae]|uniref:nickel-dependent hydrogenase large subunit n=1 Tax=Pinisolibacter aquiterrae TaxID=2815579 RepID=UPI001C3C3D23|nr:nickel-dependent hydrogenase large subunit [Pinisolibacter aquiterrae]MCC8233427.1 nickel-dependent hydrogenase large subunit [Pinisolibacter aquiterrae]
MSRVVVGPFNRVEGDLEVHLDVEEGIVVAAEVAVPLYRGFEQILVGRPFEDALVLAPRICGICSVSQSLAVARAISAFSGVVPTDNGHRATALAHAAENVADHLTHFYLFFMPDFARASYAGEAWHAAIADRFAAVKGRAARDVLPARARLLETMGLIAGKWPHSLAFRAGGTTRALDLGEIMRLRAILADVRAFAEEVLFGRRLEAIVALETLGDLDAVAAGPGDFAAFLRLSAALGLHELGRGPGLVMSFGAYPGVGPGGGDVFARGTLDTGTGARAPLAIDRIVEDPARSWLAGEAGPPARATSEPDIEREGAYSWAKAPRYGGRTVEVGALARQLVDGSALASALVAPSGATHVAGRVVMRLVETARVLLAMEGWVDALERGAPFCAEGAMPTDGSGVGLVEAARGSLGHWMTVRGGRITRYQIIAPTTWNFSPRDAAGRPGPLEGALEGIAVGAEGARSVAVQHVVRSFDPCMVCTAH